MIHLIDKSVKGDVHVMFNSAMLSVVQNIFPNEVKYFYAEDTHLQLVKSTLFETVSKNIIFSSIPLHINSSIGKSKKIYGFIKKLRGDNLYFKRFFSEIKNKNDIVIILNLPPLTYLFAKKLKSKYSSIKTLGVLHGELEYVYFAHSRREKIIGGIYKKIFKNKIEKFNYIFLNKISKSILVRDGYIKETEAVQINHPYLFTNIALNNFENSVLTVAHIGSLGNRKNGQAIFKIANILQKEISEKKIEIQTIGAIEPNLQQYQTNYVRTFFVSKDKENYLPRGIFEEQIKYIDYALFFYKETQFIHRASGAILDAIEYCKPLIVIKHPYFDYLFDIGGNIGYQCIDIDEMTQLIKKLSIIYKSPEYIKEYKIQQDNILGLKNILSITTIAKDLKKQLINLNYYEE